MKKQKNNTESEHTSHNASYSNFDDIKTLVMQSESVSQRDNENHTNPIQVLDEYIPYVLSEMRQEERDDIILDNEAVKVISYCLDVAPPSEIWQLIDVMDRFSCEDQYDQRLGGIYVEALCNKIQNDCEVNDFSPDKEPVGIDTHLSRIEALGQIYFMSARTQQEYSLRVVDEVMGFYERGNVPLISLAAYNERINAQVAIWDSMGVPQSQFTPPMLEVIGENSYYEDFFNEAHLQDGSEVFRVAKDKIAVCGLGFNAANFASVDSEIPFDTLEYSISSLESQDIAQGYHTLYDKFFLGRLMSVSGVDPRELTFQEQQKFFQFMSNAPTEEFERLQKALFAHESHDRIAIAQAFLATEFGDDMGEQVLRVAENVNASGDMLQNDAQLQALQYVTRVLQESKKFTNEGILCEVDEGLADDIRRGISTRTAEILFALNERIDKGAPIDKPLQALNKLAEWTEGMANMTEQGVPQKVQQANDTMLFHFINPISGEKYPGAIELTQRGKFREDATEREVMVKEGRGARISMTYDEDNVSAALSLKGVQRRQAMNGRLDKSTFNAETKKVEPDAAAAEVSFDIASAHAKGTPKLIADVISEARKVRNGTDTGSNGLKLGPYTYEIIDQRFGEREVFADVVESFGKLLSQREHEADSTSHSS